MAKLLKSTLLYFSIQFLLLVVAPQIIGSYMFGSSRNGIPFTYYEFNSAPPPEYGGIFKGWAFAANLSIYLIIGVLIGWIRNRNKENRTLE